MRREHDCHYLLFPPLAKGRRHETMDGKHAFELKTPWFGGTPLNLFSVEDYVAWLTVLIPP